MTNSELINAFAYAMVEQRRCESEAAALSAKILANDRLMKTLIDTPIYSYHKMIVSTVMVAGEEVISCQSVASAHDLDDELQSIEYEVGARADNVTDFEVAANE